MIDDVTIDVDKPGDRLLAGLERDEVQVAICTPVDAGDREIDRALARLGQITTNELEYRDRRETSSPDDAADSEQESDTKRTKYGDLVGGSLRTDGGQTDPGHHRIGSGGWTPERRLQSIASHARHLRDDLDHAPGDIPELAGIVAAARRIGGRHDYDLDVDVDVDVDESLEPPDSNGAWPGGGSG